MSRLIVKLDDLIVNRLKVNIKTLKASNELGLVTKKLSADVQLVKSFFNKRMPFDNTSNSQKSRVNMLLKEAEVLSQVASDHNYSQFRAQIYYRLSQVSDILKE